ncbi:MAG: hypothetical protein LBQ68_05210 [Clostridiales bacterium]|jgi:hypothetical protein|nr:hypothetical protein [Clostridiales bacterium]
MEKILKILRVYQTMKREEPDSNPTTYDSTWTDREEREGHDIRDEDYAHDIHQFHDSQDFDRHDHHDDFELHSEINEEETSYRIFDEAFTSPSIKAVKSAMRYVDPRHHKALGIWIKFMEIQNLVEICGKRSSDSYSQEGDWRYGMLLSMRPHVSYQKQCVIDLLVKAMELQEILSRLEGLRNDNLDGGI